MPNPERPVKGMSSGHLIIISASSGSGKSTLIKSLFKKMDGLFFSVSATTRRPRPGEADGVSYYFVSIPQFEAMIKNNELLEYAEYAGNYYGTPRNSVMSNLYAGKDVILDIDVQGAKLVKKKMPEAVMVFLMPPNLAELERRLRLRRTDNDEEISCRLEIAEKEFTEADKYDYVVINDDLEKAVDEIASIITSVRGKE